MNKHEYEFDEVVIGSGLNALIYSYLSLAPLIFNEENKPLFFEFFPPDADLEKLHVEPQQYELKSADSVKLVGPPKLGIWERMAFILSLSGQIPIADKVAEIRVEDNNILKITTKRFRLVKIKFNKLRIFDNENISGIGPSKKETTDFKVVDWVDVKSGMIHPYDYFETNYNFIKEIYFYPSARFDGAGKRKDIAAVSYLNKSQLATFENSDTYAKFRILRIMKNAGIRGARNGRDHLNPEKYKYYAAKVEPRRRQVKKIKPDFYENTENILFDYRSAEEIYRDLETQNSYALKLNESIARR